MRYDTPFRLYCTAKPLLATTVLGLCAGGIFGIDDSIGEFVSGLDYPDLHEITLRRLLSHTAGLSSPRASDIVLLDKERRGRAVRACRPVKGWQSNRISDYSEYASSHLLGEAIETVTGAELREVVRATLLTPLEMSNTFFQMTHSEHLVNSDTIGVFADLARPIPVPMLSDRSRSLCCDWNPGFGAYGTAHDLVRILLDVASALCHPQCGGTTVSSRSARSLAYERTGRRLDRLTRTMREFTLGFLAGLDEAGFGHHVSSAAFGHSGFFGTSSCLYDPAFDLAIGLVLNGVVADRRTAQRRRSLVIDAVYADLDLVSP